MFTEEGIRRIGDAVRARRQALGLTQDEVRGVSSAWLRQIENGTNRNPTSTKLRQLEQALGWGSSSIEIISAGGEPTTPVGTSVDIRHDVSQSVGQSVDIRHDVEAHSPETRLAAAADQIGLLLEPTAARLDELVTGGFEPGPATGEAINALEKLIGRVDEFSARLADLRNQLTE